jgi:hypothetical protein
MPSDLFVCECSSHEHILIISDDEEYCFISIHLAPLPFWQRVRCAISYIFGKRSNYGNFEEIVLGPEKMKELMNVLSKHTVKTE